MANYTIDDLEILRKKSGITYEEAVNLLEYHNGSLSRSLIDLEKNGRLKEEGPQTRAADGGKQTGLKKLFNTLFRIRFMVKHQGMVVANLSCLFMIATVMLAPHLAVGGLIVSLILNYRISIERNHPAFVSDTFDSMLETAKTNVQNTMQNFSRSFSATEETEQTEPERPHSASAASGTRPVNVQFPRGTQVDIRDEGDGYHEADIG